MAGLESDTIGGFNGMLQKQKKEEGEAYITTVFFDDKYELLHDHLNITSVAMMDERQYYVRGCTALFDAMGRTIQKMVNIQKGTKEEEKAEKIIFVIITDGLENASREYTCDRLRSMIKYQTDRYGWEFIFLGANMDAVQEAAKFGIHEDRSVTFTNDSAGQILNYDVISETVSRMRVESGRIDGNWKARIERDHALRRKEG